MSRILLFTIIDFRKISQEIRNLFILANFFIGLFFSYLFVIFDFLVFVALRLIIVIMELLRTHFVKVIHENSF